VKSLENTCPGSSLQVQSWRKPQGIVSQWEAWLRLALLSTPLILSIPTTPSWQSHTISEYHNLPSESLIPTTIYRQRDSTSVAATISQLWVLLNSNKCCITTPIVSQIMTRSSFQNYSLSWMDQSQHGMDHFSPLPGIIIRVLDCQKGGRIEFLSGTLYVSVEDGAIINFNSSVFRPSSLFALFSFFSFFSFFLYPFREISILKTEMQFLD